MSNSPHTVDTLFASLVTDINFAMPTADGFPMSLWKDMASHGLLKKYSSDETAYRDIAAAGLALTRLCAYPGLTMTWLGQLLKVRFLKRYADHAKDCISTILSGDSLCAMAISEPQAGAHPKYLTCTAEQKDGYFVINGEKAYVSHGPYADWFIVLAITSVVAGKKQFSAFLIHKTQAGLSLGPGEQSTRLAPSSHCNITFNQCRVANKALIGTPGQAFEEISKPMRTLEDVLMLAPIAGAIQVQLGLLAGYGQDEIDLDILGRCLCLADSAAELGLLSAQKLDQHSELPDLTTLIIGTRALIDEVQTHLAPWLSLQPRLEALFNDIQLLSSIGQSATQVRVRSLTEQYLSQQQHLSQKDLADKNLASNFYSTKTQ